MIETLYGINLARILEFLLGNLIGIIVGIGVYRMYFNWQKELQAENKHLEELKEHVIKPLLEAMDEVTYGIFPHCTINAKDKVHVKESLLRAVRRHLMIKEEREILKKFDNELLNDLITYHAPKLGSLIKEYCRLHTEYAKAEENIDKLIKDSVYNVFRKYPLLPDVNKEQIYMFLRNNLLFGPREKFVDNVVDQVKPGDPIQQTTVLGKSVEKINVPYAIMKELIMEAAKTIIEANVIKVIEHKKEIFKKINQLSNEIREKLELLMHITKLPLIKKWKIYSIKCSYLKAKAD